MERRGKGRYMYKLSVVIPTKNRIEYCLSAVKSVLNLHNDSIQVVVQDNSEKSNAELIRTTFESCPAIKYNYHPGILSFVDNFSEAVSFAEGEYLCMIGDDDAVLPNIIAVADFAKRNGYEALVPGLNAVYCWPNETPFIPHAENGYLVLSYLKNRKRDIDCCKLLYKLMKNGGQEYQRLLLPRLYHGLVRRDMMDEIKKATGKYFDGLSPDIYNAVSLSLMCKKVCSISFPITVSGICPKSGSSDSATGKHTGKLTDAPHFRGHTNYKWDSYVPEIYSVESIWADSALCALRNFSREDIREQFNIGYLDQLCLSKYPQFKPDIKSHLAKYKISYICSKIKVSLKTIKRLSRKMVFRLLRKKRDVRKYFDVRTMEQAISITEDALNRERYIL